MASVDSNRIKGMVDRFLSWRLPADFAPDGGVSFKRSDHPNHPGPSGTNLLDARQAEEMVRHIVGGDQVDSASDARTVNNAVRHQYRALSDEEKAQMVAVKDKGAEFLALLETLRTPPQPMGEVHGIPMMRSTFDRELNIAVERVEEAVMWTVKHITA